MLYDQATDCQPDGIQSFTRTEHSGRVVGEHEEPVDGANIFASQHDLVAGPTDVDVNGRPLWAVVMEPR